MANTNIVDLPEEILEKIFLNFRDEEIILSLTEVCKKFNNVVSGSLKLMRNFTINWKGHKMKDTRALLESQRKYQKLSAKKIYKFKPSLLRFITDHAFTLTNFHFYKCAFPTSEFAKLLKIIGNNLVILSLCDVNFVNDEDAVPINCPKLEYVELMYGGGEGYSVICKFFEGADSITDFSYEDLQELSVADFVKIRDLIVSLKGVKKIQVCHTLGQKLFTDDTLMRTAKFELESLYLWMNSPEHIDYPSAKSDHYHNFFNFVDSQRKSLTYLNLLRFTLSADSMDYLLSMCQLKDLLFYDCEFQIGRTLSIENRSIQKLSITPRASLMDMVFDVEDSALENALCNILRNCVNVKKLHFAELKISFEMSMTINDCMKKLKELSFRNCDVPPITYPKVKSMSISSMEDDDVIKLIRVNRQLKYVKIPHSVQSHRKYPAAISELAFTLIDSSLY